MRTVFFILACIIGWCYGLALAGTEREARIKMLMKRYPNSIFLSMPEAMVTEDKTGSKAEGLCISGDEEHVPTLYWEQQDMLRIDFPEGCRYQTEYKLESPTEKAFFLNGQPLEETVYHLRCRPAAPKAVEVMGMERCSFLVTVAGSHHAEVQAFSPQSPVRYFFVNEKGAEVPCRVMTAQMRHIQTDGHIRTPSTTQGKLQLLRGVTDIFAEKSVDISPFGTFCAEFILPEGQDKSIGSHQIVFGTDRDLSISRLYEKQTKDGGWKKTDSFVVGDVISVSLVCTSREERKLNYLALEDYLPACMEAINPLSPIRRPGFRRSLRGNILTIGNTMPTAYGDSVPGSRTQSCQHDLLRPRQTRRMQHRSAGQGRVDV